MPRIAVRVTEMVAVTPLIKRFHLAPLDGSLLPAFSGGAHIVVDMPDAAITRRNAYSLTSSPAATTDYAISVRRDEAGRGGSRFMHEQVRPGMVLQISHPANLFPLALRARKHLLVAGGIGITPFLAMADQLFENHQDFELYYAMRSADHGAYAAELVARYGKRVHLFRSEQGERIALERVLGHQPLGTHLYVCGPAGMIEWATGLARAAGWPGQNIHQERFIAPPIGAPYSVRLARSAMEVTVGAQQSMLEAIEAAGVEAPYFCRGGVCGQCETAVLEAEGTLRHADHFLTDAEKSSGQKIMLCVSRLDGPSLVLDL